MSSYDQVPENDGGLVVAYVVVSAKVLILLGAILYSVAWMMVG